MKWNQRLTQARVAKNLSKAALSRLIKVSGPTITDWESGEIESIKGENLMKLCKALDVSESWLMNGAGVVRLRTRHLSDALSMKAESDDEMELLASYRLATPAERDAFDGAVEAVFARLETKGRNQA